MAGPSPAKVPTLHPISSLSPPSQTRAWLSAPHPTLPLIATCSSDLLVRIYSLKSFTLHSQIEGGHKRSIRSVAWKPQSHIRGESVLATGSFDASAGIWRRWDESDLVPRPDGHKSLAHHRGNGDDNEDEEDDDDWRFAVVLDGHESEIKSVAWSTSGQYLATCSRDKSVWIWEELDDDNTFETIAVLQEHDGDVKCVVWHPEEELLASASYDDTVRLYKEDVDDWICVAVLRGHDSTVWAIDFEPVHPVSTLGPPSTPAQIALVEARKKAGPRLVSCSDDLSLRVWRRIPPPPSANPVPTTGPGQGRPMPSILRSASSEQEWVEECRLPRRHDRAVYSVAWSKKSGRIVSTGGDGMVVVYEERWVEERTEMEGVVEGREEEGEGEQRRATSWEVVAQLEAAHGVFEVNHVCWAKRWDKGKKGEDEEMIVTTGDDGVVKLWSID